MQRRSRWRALGASLALTAAAVGVSVGGTATPSGAVTPNTFAAVDVPSGDVMTAGYYRTTNVVVAPGASAAGMSVALSVAATPYNTAQNFVVDFAPKTGGSLVAPMFANPTATTATADKARLVVSNGAAVCSNAAGQFVINDLVFGGGGTVSRMAMTWRIICPAMPNNPISSGYIYINEPYGPIGGGAGAAEFYPITPKRVLDTRDSGAIGAGGTVNVQVAGGASTVPANATAVVVNITAIEPTASTFLTAYPTGAARPQASNVNPVAGDVVPNLATVKVGAGGLVTLYNAVGSTHAAMDITGYFLPDDANPAFGGRFRGETPRRVLDTRYGGGPFGPGEVRTINVDAGATAAVLNVTATNPTSPTYLTLYPANESLPLASNLNVGRGQTIPNLVVVKLSGGQAKVYNAAGSTDVIVDVIGTFKLPNGGGDNSGRFMAQDPTRVYDSRNPSLAGLPNVPIGTPGYLNPRDLGLIGIDGKYPFEYAGVVANLTVTNTTAGSYLTAYPAGTAPPTASNLNWQAGETRPNLVMMGTDDYGINSFYNAAGRTDLVVDVAGWFTR